MRSRSGTSGREGLTELAPAARRGFAVLILQGSCQRVKVKAKENVKVNGAMNARRRPGVTVRMKGTYLRAAN